jgi:hypothetical protein
MEGMKKYSPPKVFKNWGSTKGREASRGSRPRAVREESFPTWPMMGSIPTVSFLAGGKLHNHQYDHLSQSLSIGNSLGGVRPVDLLEAEAICDCRLVFHCATGRQF